MINEILYFFNFNVEPFDKWYIITHKHTQNKTITSIRNTINSIEYIIKSYEEKFLSQFENEKKILEKINGTVFSPKLINTFIICIDNKKFYCFTMEKIYGTTLDNYNFICPITKNFLENTFTEIFSNIFIQYEKLHQLNISHIDSHGSNIIVCENNDICIIDFEVSFVFDKDKLYSKKDLENEPFQLSYSYDKYSGYSVQDYFINLDFGRIISCIINILSKYNIPFAQFENIYKNSKLKYYGEDKLFAYFNYLVLNYNDFGEKMVAQTYLENMQKKYNFYFSNISYYAASIVLNAFYGKCIWYTKKEYVKDKIFLMNSSKNKAKDFVLKLFESEKNKKYNREVYFLNYIKQKVNPNIVPNLICNFTHNNKFYILIENIEGGALKDKLFYNEHELVVTFKDIFKKTSELHNNGIFNVINNGKNILITTTQVCFINFSNSVSKIHPEKYYIDNNLIMYPYESKYGIKLFHYLKLIDLGQLFLTFLEKCDCLSIEQERFNTILTQLEINFTNYDELLFYFNYVLNDINYNKFDANNIDNLKRILIKYNIHS